MVFHSQLLWVLWPGFRLGAGLGVTASVGVGGPSLGGTRWLCWWFLPPHTRTNPVIFMCLLTRLCTSFFLGGYLAPSHPDALCVVALRKGNESSFFYPPNQLCPAVALHFSNRPWADSLQRWGLLCQPVPVSSHPMPASPPCCVPGPCLLLLCCWAVSVFTWVSWWTTG